MSKCFWSTTFGEIDAGDTIVFAQEGWEEQKAGELRSVTRIFGMLPEESGSAFLALWKEFEQDETPEARFAHAVDRAILVLLNLSNQGGSWREHGISYERVVGRIQPEVKSGCPALWDYLAVCLEEGRRSGWFGESSAI